MKHYVIGDVHGNFANLRNLLLSIGAINEDNERINKDSLKVYCSGDLIDGAVNRDGDLLILDYAAEWFDKVAIGNHEWAFLGGPNFGGARSKDRELMRRLLVLERRKLYVPAFMVENFLVVHAGLADRWGFRTEADALDAINFVWDISESDEDDVPMLDWIGPKRAGKWANDTGGIFWLDWSESRNKKINQIVGHSTITSGPVSVEYPNEGTIHWNIDVGGKYGYGLGGVLIENGEATPWFFGNRVELVSKSKNEIEVEVDADEDDELTAEALAHLMEEVRS